MGRARSTFPTRSGRDATTPAHVCRRHHGSVGSRARTVARRRHCPDPSVLEPFSLPGLGLIGPRRGRTSTEPPPTLSRLAVHILDPHTVSITYREHIDDAETPVAQHRLPNPPPTVWIAALDRQHHVRLTVTDNAPPPTGGHPNDHRPGAHRRVGGNHRLRRALHRSIRPHHQRPAPDIAYPTNTRKRPTAPAPQCFSAPAGHPPS